MAATVSWKQINASQDSYMQIVGKTRSMEWAERRTMYKEQCLNNDHMRRSLQEFSIQQWTNQIPGATSDNTKPDLLIAAECGLAGVLLESWLE